MIYALLAIAIFLIFFGKIFDGFLNNITMYRLVLYVLLIIYGIAVVLAFFGLLPYNPLYMLYTGLALLLSNWIANKVFAWAFDAPTNVESVYITTLILALIVTPIKVADVRYFMFIGWVSVLSEASKYMFAIGKKHIFNPAAFAVAVTAVALNQSASWWVATTSLAPFVLVGGYLIAKKIRRGDLVISFFAVALLTIAVFDILHGTNVWSAWQRTIVGVPLMFFAFIMLTEPLTTPPTKGLRILYGMLVGFLFAPQVHLGSLYSTPELALLAGNIFSYLVSPKTKLMLELKNIFKLTPDTFDFVFAANKQLAFAPGQYLEWTLPHDKPDSRGNRRYFTIASSPTEPEIHMGVKFYPEASSFKVALGSLNPGDAIVASQLAGDFTLPKNQHKKLVLIAGGIGVTPFRSMVKYLLDKNQRRDVVLLYSNRTGKDIAYKDLFDEAANRLGLKVVYTLTDTKPVNWTGRTGFINETMIRQEVPDFRERIFYISGPQAMVTAFDHMLSNLGVPESHIKKDYFPGFA